MTAAAQPTSKLSDLRACAAAGDWQGAIAIAARFPRLGIYRAAVLDAHMAYTNPRFALQLRKDLDQLKAAGRDALVRAYSLPD